LVTVTVCRMSADFSRGLLRGEPLRVENAKPISEDY
jgi:hypothetical protein